MASAKRLMEVRHFCWKSSRMAQISVPAWPMPIHQTKLVMSKAQATGMLLPQTPMPTTDGGEPSESSQKPIPAASAAISSFQPRLRRGVERLDQRLGEGAVVGPPDQDRDGLERVATAAVAGFELMPSSGLGFLSRAR